MSDHQYNPNKEQWKAIPDYPGCEVSDHGKVRSYWKRVGSHKWAIVNIVQRIIIPHLQDGYPTVNLKNNKGRIRIMVHRLVLLAFKGPCPHNMQACHNDGTRTNNHLPNLRWDYAINNKADSRRHGTVAGPKGTKHAKAKLTESQVIEIRHLFSQGYSRKKLSELFSVSYATIKNIIQPRTWLHLINNAHES